MLILVFLAAVATLLILCYLYKKVCVMSEALDELKSTVASLTTTVASAVALINGIADKIDEAIAADDAEEEGELKALSDQLRADAQSLGEAVASQNGGGEEPTDPVEPTE